MGQNEDKKAQKAALERTGLARREPRAVRRVASLWASCLSCKQLHRPERPLEFNPRCPACVRPRQRP